LDVTRNAVSDEKERHKHVLDKLCNEMDIMMRKNQRLEKQNQKLLSKIRVRCLFGLI